jgi:hypothetical protein
MLEVTNPQGQEVREFTCPNPDCKAILRVNFYDGETILAENKGQKSSLGLLVYNSQKHALHEGKNTIGRSDSKHTAEIGIESADKSMSRLHCQIEVFKLEKGKVKPVLSDLREQDKIYKKPLKVNNEPLSFYDQIVLEDGDYLLMGDTVVRFRQE